MQSVKKVLEVKWLGTFEKEFSQFIDQAEYDVAQQVIFDLVRAAFKAGWQSAKQQEQTKVIPFQKPTFL